MRQQHPVNVRLGLASVLFTTALGLVPAVPSDLGAQSPATEPAGPTIADLAWLEGAWIGEGFDGVVEEVWAPPRGGIMLGMFRLLEDDAMVFSEILMLGEFESGIELRLKHLNPDMTGWEERDDYVSFALESAAPGLARFRGLEMRAVGRDSLEIEVRLRQRSGEVVTELLRYRRLELAGAPPR